MPTQNIAPKDVTRYYVSMNITLSLDDDLIAAAKSLAARSGTSVSALVRSALEHQVSVDQQSSTSGAAGVLQTLFEYSMGRISRGVAMRALGMDDYGALLRLMNMAGLPHPLVPLATRKTMAQKMVEMLKGAGVVP